MTKYTLEHRRALAGMPRSLLIEIFNDLSARKGPASPKDYTPADWWLATRYRVIARALGRRTISGPFPAQRRRPAAGGDSSAYRRTWENRARRVA